MKTSFPSLATNQIGPFRIDPAPAETSAQTHEMYRKVGYDVVNYRVSWVRKDTGKSAETIVDLYHNLKDPRIPRAFGRNGIDEGSLSFAGTTLSDYDGVACLPRSVVATLRAIGFTVSDDCLANPF